MKTAIDVLIDTPCLMTPIVACIIVAMEVADKVVSKDANENWDQLVHDSLHALGNDITQIHNAFMQDYADTHGEAASQALALKCMLRTLKEARHLERVHATDELLNAPLVNINDAKEVLNKFMKG